MTILEDALKKDATDNLRRIAEDENVDLRKVFKAVSKGSAVVIQRKKNKPVGIGFPFRTKINVNIGHRFTTSSLLIIQTF